MLGNDRMETASTAVSSIRCWNNIEKSTLRTHRCFVDFESWIHVEISTSNQCHNFHVDSPFKIDEISANFPRGISTSVPWRIDEDVSMDQSIMTKINFYASENWCALDVTIKHSINIFTFWYKVRTNSIKKWRW